MRLAVGKPLSQLDEKLRKTEPWKLEELREVRMSAVAGELKPELSAL